MTWRSVETYGHPSPYLRLKCALATVERKAQVWVIRKQDACEGYRVPTSFSSANQSSFWQSAYFGSQKWTTIARLHTSFLTKTRSATRVHDVLYHLNLSPGQHNSFHSSRHRNKITKAWGLTQRMWIVTGQTPRIWDLAGSRSNPKIGRSCRTNHWFITQHGWPPALTPWEKTPWVVRFCGGHHEAVAPLNQGIQEAALQVLSKGLKEAIWCIFSIKRERRSIRFIGFQCFTYFVVCGAEWEVLGVQSQDSDSPWLLLGFVSFCWI